MSAQEQLDVLPRAVLQVGRKRAKHLPRVLIKDERVVLHTRCGIDPAGPGFTETTGYPTCTSCAPDEAGR